MDNLEAQLSSHLKDHDQIVCLPGLTEIALYDQGVRRATTHWVFISEPHVEVASDAIEEMMCYLEESGLDGAACYSIGSVDNNFVARLEDSVFADDLNIKGQPDHWNKIVLKGCCIHKSAFLDAGGFIPRYGHFSEPSLGARLHDCGYRIGLCDHSRSFHYGCRRLCNLVQQQIEYGYCEMLCCTLLDEEFEARYFALMDAVRRTSSVPFRWVLLLMKRSIRRSPGTLRVLAMQSGPWRRSGYYFGHVKFALYYLVIHLLRIRPIIARKYLPECGIPQITGVATGFFLVTFVKFQIKALATQARGWLPQVSLAPTTVLGFIISREMILARFAGLVAAPWSCCR